MTAPVWFLVEWNGRRARGLSECARELAGEARALADGLRTRLSAVVMGDALEALVEPVTQLDVDDLYCVQHELLAQYSTADWVSVLAQLLQANAPGPLLVSATPNGSDLAARLAARLNLPLVCGCIWVKTGPAGDVRLVKPVLAGRAQMTHSAPAGSAFIATVQPGVVGIDPPKRWRTPQVFHWTPELSAQDLGVRREAFIPGDPHSVPLSEAERIVAGGRGVQDAAGWSALEQVADVLGAAAGGSRAAMDLGYIPRSRMIGQTGTQVRPRLYLAAGISGVTHHLGGVKAETIVAINTDRGAPVFKQAALGVLGDLHEVLPRLAERLRAAKAALEKEQVQ